MKKKILVISLVLFSLTLVSCSKNTNQKEGESTISTDEKNAVSVFKGTVSELPVIDEDVVNIAFDHIQAINDPDEIVDNLNASGVILLAPFDVFEKSLKPEDVALGQELVFELESPAVMTFSLPPQVAGNSIKLIEKSK